MVDRSVTTAQAPACPANEPSPHELLGGADGIEWGVTKAELGRDGGRHGTPGAVVVAGRHTLSRENRHTLAGHDNV